MGYTLQRMPGGLLLASPGEFANQIDFVLPVGSIILPEDLVEPDRRLDLDIRALP